MRLLFLLVAGALCLVIGLGVFSVYNAHTNNEPAEAFLNLLGENKPREAFDSTTTGFQEGFKWTRFSEFVSRFHLVNYQPGSLHTSRAFTEYRQKSGLTIVLAGDAALRDGRPFHLDMTLCKENQRWKVEHIYVNFSKRRPSTAETPPPPRPAGTDTATNLSPLTLRENGDKPRILPAKPTGTDSRDATPAFSPAKAPPAPAASPS